MLSWTPDNTEPLLETDEEEVNINLSISVSDDFGDVIIQECIIDQPVEVFTATINGGNISLHADNLAGIYEIIHIQYLRNGIEEEVYDWNDLPEDAEDLISYRKEKGTPKIVTITVTAEGTDDTGLSPATETRTYELIINANYTGGKIKLQEEVNKRR